MCCLGICVPDTPTEEEGMQYQIVIFPTAVEGIMEGAGPS